MIGLRFVTASDLASRAIRGAQMGFWASHVEAVEPTSRRYIGAHMDGGVQSRAPDYDAWTVELFVDMLATPEQAQAFYACLTAQIGKPYDMAAVADMAEGVLTGGDFATPEQPSWICSALITAGLLKAGIIRSAPLVRLATPRDVLFMCAALLPIGEPEHA